MKFTDDHKHRCFFVADTHWFHRSIIKFTLRTFCLNAYEKSVFDTEDAETINALPISDETIRKHDETLIHNWNAKVRPEDTVFHLGDFALGGDDEYAAKILKRLNGSIFYVEGNHDKVIQRVYENRLINGTEGKIISYNPGLAEISINGQKIVLCHYAMKVWRDSHRNSWQLFGHSHGSLPDDPNSLSMDVGIDCEGTYSPFSFQQVKEIMSKKKFMPIDHHNEKTT